MSSSLIGRPAACALLIIHFIVMSLRPRLPLPPPISECTPRNQTSSAPASRERNERRPALVERQGVEAVLNALGRQREVVAKVQRLVAEKAEAKGRRRRPTRRESEWADRPTRRVGSGMPNAALLNEVAEVERGGGAAAEADDVDDRGRCVNPVLHRAVVRLVQSRQFARAEHAANDVPDQLEPRADAGHVELLVPALLR